jgi:uncharacterized membrane protein YgcG
MIGAGAEVTVGVTGTGAEVTVGVTKREWTEDRMGEATVEVTAEVDAEVTAEGSEVTEPSEVVSEARELTLLRALLRPEERGGPSEDKHGLCLSLSAVGVAQVLSETGAELGSRSGAVTGSGFGSGGGARGSGVAANSIT